MAERNIRITRIENQRSELFSGPVPDPESLEKYELIHPGFADRLIKLAEEEQKNRLELNRLLVENEIQNQKRSWDNYRLGQLFAIIAVSEVVLLCTVGFFLGYSNSARDIAVIVIVALAGVFLSKWLRNTH
jgi:uncharacterized membrane protein